VKNAYKIVNGKPERKRPVERDRGLDGRIILRWFFEK
jgi:hypothetical protein